MPDLAACINAAIADGVMDAQRGEQARQMFLELDRDYSARYGASGRSRAAKETVRRVQADAALKARQRLLQLVTLDNIVTGLSNASDPETAALKLIEALGGGGTQVSARAHREAVLGQAHAILEDAIERFRRDLAGRSKDKATQMDVAREAFGERTGNETAKTMARALSDAFEFLRGEFNRAGGAIGKLENYGLPTRHDWIKVRAATYKPWRDAIWPLLDRQKMVDYATGSPMTDTELENLLADSFRQIASDGWVNRQATMNNAGKSLANRRGDSRHLHFKDFDAWQAYQKQFGNPDVFETIVAHMDGMSRDIGAMRALGPNPLASIRFVKAWLEKRAKDNLDNPDPERALAKGEALETLYMHYTGEVNRPVRERVSRFFETVRSALTGIQLGAAAISATTDPGFGAITARHNGLRVSRYLARYASLLNPASEADRRLAVRMGLIAEEATKVAASMARFTGEIQGLEFFKRFSDGVMRVSGLAHITQTGKFAFGLEYFAVLADHAHMAFDALPEPLSRQMAAYNITAADWDVMRSAPLYEHAGEKFMRPDEIAGLDAGRAAQDAATKLLAIVNGETEFAVPSVSLTGRAMLLGRNRPGTIPGELIRSGLMYKNFGLTLMFTHLARGIAQRTTADRAGYFASLILTTGVLGAFALQMKEIAKGRDPREMDNGRFFAAAVLQGGGLGIMGDFLFADTSRFGAGFAETVAGPVVGAFSDASRLTVGNVYAALDGKDPKLGADIAATLGRYTPGGSIWYLRALYERAVVDQVRAVLDPEADKYFRRRETAAKRDYGSGYWWRPGEAAPGRAPDLGF